MKLLFAFLLLFAGKSCDQAAKDTIAAEPTNKMTQDETDTQDDGIIHFEITELWGRDVSDLKMTMRWDNNNNRISGKSACNEYNGIFKIADDRSNINFGPMMMSKMFCAEAMTTEREFSKAISETTSVDLDDMGGLSFHDNINDTILVAKRVYRGN